MRHLLRSLTLLALAGLPLLAHPGGRGPGGERMMRALDLTEAQKTSIQALRDKHRPTLTAKGEAARTAQAAFRTAWMNDATPEAQLRTLHDQASAARFEMQLAQRSLHQEIQAVLTPEQRTKAAELRGEARGRFMERMHHLGRGMGPAGPRSN